jgi:hypothetical protein
MLGAGLSSSNNSKISIKDSSGKTTDEVNSPSSTGLALEYSLGWKF